MKKVEEFFVYKVRNLLGYCAMLRLNDDCPMDIAKLSHFGADAKKPGSSKQLVFLWESCQAESHLRDVILHAV